MLCDKCHKYQTHKPSKACDFCVKLGFSEDLLCWIARNCADHGNLSECGAYRPTLSVVSPKQHILESIEIEEMEPRGFTDKDKWFRAYAKQQLQLNPETVQFKLQFHVSLVTLQRKKVFSNSQKYRENIIGIFQQIVNDFENTQIEVLWICADHIHLHLSTTPDYSLDEIVEKLIKNSAQEIQALDTELVNDSNGVWETGYFAETIV